METNKKIDWSIRIDKQEYKPGEKVSIVGTFFSREMEAGVWRVHLQFNRVGAVDFPATVMPHSIKLEPGKEREVVIEELKVNDDLAPGEYSARIGLEMSRGVLDFKEVFFKIVGTPKPFDFRIVFSTDKDGKELKKIFTAGDKEVYIKVTCDVQGILFSGTCKNPVGDETALEFKDAVSSYLLSGEGAYRLSVTAQAQGYKTMTRQDIFSVIKDIPVFKRLTQR